MNALATRPSATRRTVSTLALLLLAGCNIVPSAPVGSARPTGPDRQSVAVYALPDPGIVLTRGISDRLDLGASLEPPLMARLWGKYTLVDRSRFALALTASAFAGPLRSHGDAVGASIGPVAELDLHPRMRLVAAASYNRLRHDTYEPDGEFIDFDFEPEAGEDFSEIAQVSAFVEIGGTRRLRLGVACDHYVSNDPPSRVYRESKRCLPMIGIGATLG